MLTSILHFEHCQTQKSGDDAHANIGNVFVVADGVSHDLDDDGNYPNPSDSALVAQIVCTSIVNSLQQVCTKTDHIQDAFISANSEVKKFNACSIRFKNRETNGYDIGAATVAVVVINGDKLIYGVLDDCYVSVFGKDYVDHPHLQSHVDLSACYLDANFDWSDMATRKLWRKELRNSIYISDGKTYGYGALDGREGFLQYLQVGQVNLTKGDLVCVYTDGFIKLIKDRRFVQELRENTFSDKTHTFITTTAIELQATKEKTGYFIQI